MNDSLFDKLFVGYPEYNFFNTLPGIEKVHYLFEIFDIEVKRNGKDTLINGLNDFFHDISEEADQWIEFDSYDFGDDKTRVDVMIDSENIVVESNSLKAVRYIAHKFMDNGYLLKRNSESEKIFRKNKVTRYLRVYKIIGQFDGLCYN